MLGEAIGAAVGGIAQGAFNLYGTHLQNKANKEMNAQNLKLAYTQRGDTLKQQGFENAMAIGDRAYQKLQNRRQAVQDRMQNDMAFRANVIQMLNSTRR